MYHVNIDELHLNLKTPAMIMTANVAVYLIISQDLI